MPMQRQTETEQTNAPVMEAERSEKPEWWDSLFAPAPEAPEAPAPVEIEAPVSTPEKVEKKTRTRYRSRLLSKDKGYHSHPRPTYDQMQAAKINRGGGGCPICGLPASRCYWWAMNGG